MLFSILQIIKLKTREWKGMCVRLLRRCLPVPGNVLLGGMGHKAKRTQWPFWSFGHQEAGPSKTS